MAPDDAVVVVNCEGFIAAVDQVEAGQGEGVVGAAAGVVEPVFAHAENGVAAAFEGVVAASGAAGADFNHQVGRLADFVDDVAVGDGEVLRVDSPGDDAVGSEPSAGVVDAVEAEVDFAADGGVGVAAQPGFQGLVGAGDLLGVYHIVQSARGVGHWLQVGVVTGRRRMDSGRGGHWKPPVWAGGGRRRARDGW